MKILNNFLCLFWFQIPSDDIDNLQSMIDELFVFALIWSVMATCDADSREKFS